MSYLAGVADRTWPVPDMSSRLWLERPIWEFKFSELWVTQDGVKFKYLLDPKPTVYGGDKYAHVIVWNERFYLEDGHHRLVRAMLDGEVTLACRWLEV